MGTLNDFKRTLMNLIWATNSQKIEIQMSVRSFQFDANDYLFQLIQFYFKLDIIEKRDGRHNETQADRKMERERM